MYGILVGLGVMPTGVSGVSCQVTALFILPRQAAAPWWPTTTQTQVDTALVLFFILHYGLSQHTKLLDVGVKVTRSLSFLTFPPEMTGAVEGAGQFVVSTLPVSPARPPAVPGHTPQAGHRAPGAAPGAWTGHTEYVCKYVLIYIYVYVHIFTYIWLWCNLYSCSASPPPCWWCTCRSCGRHWGRRRTSRADRTCLQNYFYLLHESARCHLCTEQCSYRRSCCPQTDTSLRWNINPEQTRIISELLIKILAKRTQLTIK